MSPTTAVPAIRDPTYSPTAAASDGSSTAAAGDDSSNAAASNDGTSATNDSANQCSFGIVVCVLLCMATFIAL